MYPTKIYYFREGETKSQGHLTEGMRKLIEEKLGLSQEEIWEQDFPELDPKRIVPPNLFYSREELEEKKRLLSKKHIITCYKIEFYISKGVSKKAKNFFLWKFYSMLAYIENIENKYKTL